MKVKVIYEEFFGQPFQVCPTCDQILPFEYRGFKCPACNQEFDWEVEKCEKVKHIIRR